MFLVSTSVFILIIAIVFLVELSHLLYSFSFFLHLAILLIISHLTAVMHCRSLPHVQVVGFYRNYVSGKGLLLYSLFVH